MNLHDTMKTTIQLMEDRIDHPDVEYKETKTKGVVTKVIAKMASYVGGSWTRLGNQYMKLEFQEKRLARKKQELKDKMRDKIASDTFNPADEAYTRVVETKDVIAKITKATMKKFGGKMTVKDKDAMIANLPQELTQRVDFLTEDMLPELIKAIDLIIVAYTPEEYEKETKPAFTVNPTAQAKEKMQDKLNQLESTDPTQFINEEYTDDVRYQRLEQMLSTFFNKYDRKLAKVSQGL